jgi:hypothetical protein
MPTPQRPTTRYLLALAVTVVAGGLFVTGHYVWAGLAAVGAVCLAPP